MKRNVHFIFAIVTALFLGSCSKEELPVFESLGNYQYGFFVVNEGNGAAGSISFVKSDFNKVIPSVFDSENPGNTGIGGYVQSLFFDGDKAYIISNGSNQITVVNRYTFKLITKITTGFAVPRYGVVVNGKAYVTNLNTFDSNTDDFITVINLATNTLEDPIQVNAIADKITAYNGKLYVINGNYVNGSSVTIINPVTKLIEKTIDLGKTPNSFEENNGSLYVLCSDDAASKLVKINLVTNVIDTEIPFPVALTNAQNLNIETDKLYFTIGSKVYADAISSTTISETPLFSSIATTLYGFSVKGNVIYVADALDYTSDGKVYLYTTAGTLGYTMTVGLNPNGFYFN